MTTIANLALIFGIAGTTALLTGVFWAAALHKERHAHDVTQLQLDYALDQLSSTAIAHALAVADLRAHGITGSMRRHPAGGKPALRAVPPLDPDDSTYIVKGG